MKLRKPVEAWEGRIDFHRPTVGVGGMPNYLSTFKKILLISQFVMGLFGKNVNEKDIWEILLARQEVQLILPCQ